MNGATTSGTGLSTCRAILQGALASPSWPRPGYTTATEAEKLLVQYEDKPKVNNDAIAACSSPDSCTLLAGQISPQGWCALVTAKPK